MDASTSLAGTPTRHDGAPAKLAGVPTSLAGLRMNLHGCVDEARRRPDEARWPTDEAPWPTNETRRCANEARRRAHVPSWIHQSMFMGPPPSFKARSLWQSCFWPRLVVASDHARDRRECQGGAGAELQGRG